MQQRVGGLALFALVAALFGAAACGGDDNKDAATNTPTAPAASPAVVNVTLQEYEIVPDKASAPAGKVTFRAKNQGPESKHEMVVIPTDLAPGALPADDKGTVDEDTLGPSGEIGEFDVGGTGEVTLDLKAGKYVLICNIVEEKNGTTVSHYKNGMRTAFTVD